MGAYIILFVTALLLRAAEGDIKEALAGMIPAALMLADRADGREKREKQHWLSASFGVGNAESAVIFNGRLKA